MKKKRNKKYEMVDSLFGETWIKVNENVLHNALIIAALGDIVERIPAIF